MSTLKVTNIQDTSGGNSSTTEQIKNGIAKAWVNFNGTGTVAIRAQYNVSSITDRGTGRYTINFITAMPDNNYAACGTSQDNGGYLTFHETGTYATVFSTTSLQVETYGSGNEDTTAVCYSIFR